MGKTGFMTPEDYNLTATSLKWLLGAAWLLPLLGFVIEIFGGHWGGRKSKTAAWIAVGCIATSFVLSLSAMVTWRRATHEIRAQQAVALLAHDAAHGHAEHGEVAHAGEAAGPHAHTHKNHVHTDRADFDPLRTTFTGEFYRLARFGSLVVSMDYYISSQPDT
jgi:NADH-quinone oxidoreductase subunit L